MNAILVSCLAPIMAGGQVTILPRFAPNTLLAAVSRYWATYFSAVPAIYTRLAELPAEQLRDTSSVQFVVCRVAPVSAELLRRSESRFGFPVIEGYGLTEGTCARAQAGLIVTVAGSAGRTIRQDDRTDLYDCIAAARRSPGHTAE